MTRSIGLVEAPQPMPATDMRIIDIVGSNMISAVTKIHLEAFQGYLNTHLGPSYAHELIQWFTKQDSAIALAAIDSNHQIIGYAIGAPVGLAQKLRRDMFWITAQSLVLHPCVILDKRLWKAGRARFSFNLEPKNVNAGPDLAEPTFSLRGIGVRSSHQHRGVGKLLLNAFEERAKMLRAKSLLLWVYSDKAATRRLYEKCGWKACPDSITVAGTIKYVRVLDPYRS